MTHPPENERLDDLLIMTRLAEQLNEKLMAHKQKHARYYSRNYFADMLLYGATVMELTRVSANLDTLTALTQPIEEA